MAQLTLLQIVQDILGEMDGDAVNSISDTIESQSIASVVRQTFYDIVEEMDIPGRQTLGSLEGLGDVSRPNVMQIPSNVNKVLWIKYDIRADVSSDKRYSNITYKNPLEFVEYVNYRPSTDTTNYQVVQWDSNVPLIIRKTHYPEYWTSFDDDLIVFDGYDSNVDTTLQASKSICQLQVSPTLVLADNSVPDLPNNLNRLLYTQALARCCADFKAQLNPKHERNENRFRVRSQRNKWREGRMVKSGPDYGRKP